MSAIQQQLDLIEVLKSINNGSKEVYQQIEHAERRLRELEEKLIKRREQKSFVRRIEREVGQEKLSLYFTHHGLMHLYPMFRSMTLHEFKRSDPMDWPPLGEADLRRVLFIQ